MENKGLFPPSLASSIPSKPMLLRSWRDFMKKTAVIQVTNVKQTWKESCLHTRTHTHTHSLSLSLSLPLCCTYTIVFIARSWCDDLSNLTQILLDRIVEGRCWIRQNLQRVSTICKKIDKAASSANQDQWKFRTMATGFVSYVSFLFFFFFFSLLFSSHLSTQS
jgi:hypothetical protein